jgi:hypothetical protein
MDLSRLGGGSARVSHGQFTRSGSGNGHSGSRYGRWARDGLYGYAAGAAAGYGTSGYGYGTTGYYDYGTDGHSYSSGGCSYVYGSGYRGGAYGRDCSDN